MRTAIKSRDLAELLRNSILAGEPPSGGLLPREIDLAARHDVSRDTVRAALDILEQQRLIRRIRGKGTQICSQEPTCTSVKVIFPGPGPLNWHYSRLMLGIIEVAHSHGIRIESIMGTTDHIREHMNLDTFRSLEIGANVILPGLQWWRDILPILCERRCRVVCIDNRNSDESGLILPYIGDWKRVTLDFPENMRLLSQILRKQGKSRTVIFQMSLAETSAYFDELTKNHIHFDWRWFIPYSYGSFIHPDKARQKSELRQYLLPLLKRAIFEAGADSVIFNNLDVMMATFDIFREWELQVPDDIVCVALEDYGWQSGHKELAVSSLQYSWTELGATMLNCFLAPYFHPEIRRVSPFFIERESSRCGAGNPPGIIQDVPVMPDNWTL